MLIVRVVAVHKRIEGNEFRQLTAKYLGMTTKLMNHDLRGLLILCEITALEEPSRSGRVHEEIWGAIELYNKTAWLSRFSITIFQVDVLNEGERILDLVSGLVVVDVVCHTGLVR